MSSLADMRNIGPRSAAWLSKLGIRSIDDLLAVGVVEAYRRAKGAFPEQVSLNLLYALQGAVLDIEWNLLPESMKEELRRQVGE